MEAYRLTQGREGALLWPVGIKEALPIHVKETVSEILEKQAALSGAKGNLIQRMALEDNQPQPRVVNSRQLTE